MNDWNISEMIQLFQKNRVPYLRKHILNPPYNHNAIISQWARWWIEDTSENAERGVFDEAISCEGKRRADIMFLEKSLDNFFEIKGIAEIENNINDDENKYLEKLETLKIYDEMTEKFPDLKFVILSTIMVIDNKNSYLDYFTELLEETKKYSKDSCIYWIIYIIKIIENRKDPREFNVSDKVKGYPRYAWYHEYENQGAYVILQDGIEIIKENWPE